MPRENCKVCDGLKDELFEATLHFVDADSQRKAFQPSVPFGKSDAKQVTALDEAREKAAEQKRDVERKLNKHFRAHHC
jgi:hypothetical protein